MVLHGRGSCCLPSSQEAGGQWHSFSARHSPYFAQQWLKKPGCCYVPGAILSPSHSPQNGQEDFIHESCGVKDREINAWCILNMPDNNCCHSPWKYETMDTHTGGLGWFVLVDCLGIFWVGSFLGSVIHLSRIWGIRVLFSSSPLILVTPFCLNSLSFISEMEFCCLS